MKVVTRFVASVVAVTALAVTHATAMELPANDYPTFDRADYVFACMQTNGQTREMLEKCACSIDRIAELLPFNEYIEAETIKSVGMRGGDSQSLFNSPKLQLKIKTLQLAQVEAELRCF